MARVTSISMVIAVLALTFAACVRMPTAEEAQGAVLALRRYEGWAWAVGVALIWADLVLPIPQIAVIAALGIIYGALLGGLLGSLGLITSGLLGYTLMRTSALFSLAIFSSRTDGFMTIWLALSGCILAVLGATLILRARSELGPAWSLVPRADPKVGLVTTGPYRVVRHPIYLGLALLAMGEAITFGNWPALLLVLGGIIPTFAWRAHAEERLLSRTFGDHHALYRRRTRMIIPHLL